MAEAIAITAKAAAAWVFSATGSPWLAVAASTAVVGTAYIGVQLGLNALAQAQLPDPESGKLSRRQPRPLRVVAMGLPSRMTAAEVFGQ